MNSPVLHINGGQVSPGDQCWIAGPGPTKWVRRRFVYEVDPAHGDALLAKAAGAPQCGGELERVHSSLLHMTEAEATQAAREAAMLRAEKLAMEVKQLRDYAARIPG